MDMDLSHNELRVIGCLIEKEITTPDQYPLSLNALVNACNQKSNRDPVLNLDEVTVQQVVDELVKKRLVREESGFGSRVCKYKHRFCNTEFSELQLTEQELAILCVLFLRGPQTPGELRTRTNRLCHFDDLQQVEQSLTTLLERESGALVLKLPREAGRRESRFAHLFGAEKQATDFAISVAGPADANVTGGAGEQQVDALEQQLEALQFQVDTLKQQVDRLQAQLDELVS